MTKLIYTESDVDALITRVRCLEERLRHANRCRAEAATLPVAPAPSPVTLRTSWDRVPGWVVVLLLAGFAVGMAIGVNMRPLR